MNCSLCALMDAYVAAGGKSPPGVCAVTSQSRVASKARDEPNPYPNPSPTPHPNPNPNP